MPNVFLACPTYDNTIVAGASQAVWAGCTKLHQVYVSMQGQSLLAKNFNEMWCDALNQRESRDLKYFAMLHADIQPEAYWLDKLIAELDANDADVMSAIVPIKDNRGVTSTAIAYPGDPYRVFTRLTVRQMRHPSFPATFDIAGAVEGLAALPPELRVEAPRTNLLINTGCWVARFDRPWNEKIHFEIRDKIAKENGKFFAKNLPEDWNFSSQLVMQNAKVMATRNIKLIHYGIAAYGNTADWGDEKDTTCLGLAL